MTDRPVIVCRAMLRALIDSCKMAQSHASTA